MNYLVWRGEEARRIAKAQRLRDRLRNAPEVFHDQIDRRTLRRCPRCEEIVYPDPEVSRSCGSRSSCHFCGTERLEELSAKSAGST
jgi:hypothetical protein